MKKKFLLGMLSGVAVYLLLAPWFAVMFPSAMDAWIHFYARYARFVVHLFQ